MYLWCLVHGMSCKAAAPTGIAAANIEIEGTNICAATLHNVFDLDSEYKSSLDFSKPSLDKAAHFFIEQARQQHTQHKGGGDSEHEGRGG